MPGYKSLTIRDSIYDVLYSYFEDNKFELEKQGINSFSGFIAKLLVECLDGLRRKKE